MPCHIFFVDEAVVWIAQEHEVGRLLGQLGRQDRISTRAARLLCNDVREVGTVHLVQGELVTPERYIASWILTAAPSSQPDA